MTREEKIQDIQRQACELKRIYWRNWHAARNKQALTTAEGPESEDEL